jgi:4-diphosphocytidyl-2-C-methyl-D-erythritol kinase
MPTRVRSYSKINLGLAVGAARADGFHALTTAYQTIALHDLLTVSARRSAQTKVHLTSNHPGVPRTETGDAEHNTAYKIVAATLQRLQLTAEVSLHIEKRLPVRGGLGAGSANAVAALIGLERELELALPGPDRLALAAEVGSDVPLFLLGGTVLGLGRGEEVYPLPDLPPTPCVVAVPDLGVSTAEAFRELDRRTPGAHATGGDPLTSSPAADKLKMLSCALAAVWTATGAELGRLSAASSVPKPSPTGIASHLRQDKTGLTDQRSDLAENPLLALVRTGMVNDFEEVVFTEHPSLRSTKRELMGSGSSQALYAALSGSGSALFGLYRSTADAVAAQQRVQASGTRALLTETLPRPEYWRTMLEIEDPPNGDL